MAIDKSSGVQSGFGSFKIKAIPTLLSMTVLVALHDSFYAL